MKYWRGDKNSVFKTLGASNHTVKEREQNDYYATDPIAIDKLLSVYELPKEIWECACGEGHLSKRLKELGYDVLSSDLIDRGYGTKVDFLNATIMTQIPCILTNPPYKYATEFVLKALEILPEDGVFAMFLKTTFLEGKERYEKIFKKYPPRYVFQFISRVLCAKNGDFSGTDGSAVSYAWFIWEKNFVGDTIIRWI